MPHPLNTLSVLSRDYHVCKSKLTYAQYFSLHLAVRIGDIHKLTMDDLPLRQNWSIRILLHAKLLILKMQNCIFKIN